jgi:hypothetical protein
MMIFEAALFQAAITSVTVENIKICQKFTIFG